MQCPSQDLGLSRAESGLRRILQDCRTSEGPDRETRVINWQCRAAPEWEQGVEASISLIV